MGIFGVKRASDDYFCPSTVGQSCYVTFLGTLRATLACRVGFFDTMLLAEKPAGLAIERYTAHGEKNRKTLKEPLGFWLERSMSSGQLSKCVLNNPFSHFPICLYHKPKVMVLVNSKSGAFARNCLIIIIIIIYH